MSLDAAPISTEHQVAHHVLAELLRVHESHPSEAVAVADAFLERVAPDLPPRTAALIATGGRYADLARWAGEWGVTATQARLEWHRLRLPVVKGGAV